MNKQKKQFVVVVILMAVCIIGYFGVGKFYKNQEEKESENKEATAITAFELKDYEKEQQDNSKSTGNGFGTYVTDVRIRDESAEYNSAAGIEETAYCR